MAKMLSSYRSLLRSVPPLVTSLLVLAVVGMNLLANKSIDTGVDWLAMDCGILFSWLAFLSMDILTHTCGPRAATAVSMTALALNLIMAFLFFLASRIPGVWGESFVEGHEELLNTALDNTLGGTWFIILGSAVAFAASAIVNNFVNYGVGKLLPNNVGFGVFALRAYVSTFVGQFADNLIFALLVSRLFFNWTLPQCVTCAVTGAVLELLCEVVFSPIGYGIFRGVVKKRRPMEAGA